MGLDKNFSRDELVLINKCLESFSEEDKPYFFQQLEITSMWRDYKDYKIYMERQLSQSSTPSSKTYITYGTHKVVKCRLPKVSDQLEIVMNKPLGCFWGSPIDAEYGWKDFCESEDFRTETLTENVTWGLKPSARVLEIVDAKSIIKLPLKIEELMVFRPQVDYNLLKNRYDAVELLTPRLGHSIKPKKPYYYTILEGGFEGWDCESIVILNPEIIDKRKG